MGIYTPTWANGPLNVEYLAQSTAKWTAVTHAVPGTFTTNDLVNVQVDNLEIDEWAA